MSTSISPAREALAWVDAGVGWRAAAAQVGLLATHVGDLVLAREMTRLHQMEQQHGIRLLTDDPHRCRVSACPDAPHDRGLCVRHYTRLRDGSPLIGPTRVRQRSCQVCGVAWCLLPGAKVDRRTCGESSCAAEARRRPVVLSAQRRARDVAIMEQVRAGVQYPMIAAEFGLSVPRIGQMARAAGVRRYGTRRGRRGPRPDLTATVSPTE